MIDFHYIETVSSLCPLINNELLYPLYTENISPISLTIIHRSSMYNKLALFLLAKTLLRFSDLQKLNLKTAIEQKQISIRQEKTDKIVSIDFLILSQELRNKLSSIDDLSKHLNYESIRSELRWITPESVRSTLLDNNSSTHIFRHLEASYLHSKGFSRTKIARRLGHFDIGTQKFYIHSFPLFSI